jgi:hypothetical protein
MSKEADTTIDNIIAQASAQGLQVDSRGATKPQTEAPRQPNEERLSRMLVHHIQQATAGGAERRY